jgi:hypothetical protein
VRLRHRRDAHPAVVAKTADDDDRVVIIAASANQPSELE